MNESEHPAVPAPEPAGQAAGPRSEVTAPTAEPAVESAVGRGEERAGEPNAEAAGAGTTGVEAGESGDSPGSDHAVAEGPGGRRRRRRRRRQRGAGEPGAPASNESGAEPGPASPTGGGETGQSSRPQARHGRERDRRPFGHDRGRHHGRPDSSHHALQAVRALAEMAAGLLRIEGVDPLAMPRFLELNLRVPIDGGGDMHKAASTAVEQILQRVREVREHERALRPGAVFSYFAGSSHAEGCRPTEPRQVFDGYSSTGKPVFSDFVTMAIERKDQNIDRLLAGEDIVITRVTMGRVLRTQQLAEFGGNSPVFKILGQVDAGLFRVLGAAGKCAFSFQLLRGTTLEGRVRLRLHAVGAVDPMDLADPALMQILSRFQRVLDQEALRLQGQSQQGEVDEEAFVLPLLNDLARQLQNRTRNALRRTQHGLERSEAGQRPTSRAYPDAGEASDDAILWDLDQNTIVVLGGKGRVHVFSPQGRHVTSVMMQGSAIDRRRHMGRWRPAEPEERGEFRIHIKRLVANGEDKPQDEPAPAAGTTEAPRPSTGS